MTHPVHALQAALRPFPASLSVLLARLDGDFTVARQAATDDARWLAELRRLREEGVVSRLPSDLAPARRFKTVNGRAAPPATWWRLWTYWWDWSLDGLCVSSKDPGAFDTDSPVVVIHRGRREVYYGPVVVEAAYDLFARGVAAHAINHTEMPVHT